MDLRFLSWPDVSPLQLLGYALNRFAGSVAVTLGCRPAEKLVGQIVHPK
jgi:hypothetical protein